MDITEQLKRGEETLAKDERHKEGLLRRLQELAAVADTRARECRDLQDQLAKASNEPIRLKRQGETTAKALSSMKAELAELVRLVSSSAKKCVVTMRFTIASSYSRLRRGVFSAGAEA